MFLNLSSSPFKKACAASFSVTPPHYAFRIVWKITCILSSGWELLLLASGLCRCIRMATLFRHPESGENHHSFLVCGFYRTDLHPLNLVYEDSAPFHIFAIVNGFFFHDYCAFLHTYPPADGLCPFTHMDILPDRIPVSLSHLITFHLCLTALSDRPNWSPISLNVFPSALIVLMIASCSGV